MNLDHRAAADLLDRFVRARTSFDGDAWTDLFSPDVEFHEDPFEPPLVGSNAVRAFLLAASAAEEQVEWTVERHWVVAPAILASWHASYVRRSDRARVRVAGFMTLEMTDDGRVGRLRQWWQRRDTPAVG